MKTKATIEKKSEETLGSFDLRWTNLQLEDFEISEFSTKAGIQNFWNYLSCRSNKVEVFK